MAIDVLVGIHLSILISSGKSTKEIRREIGGVFSSLDAPMRNAMMRSPALISWIDSNKEDLHQILIEENDLGKPVSPRM